MLIRNHVAIVFGGVAVFVASVYHFGTSDEVVRRVLSGQLMERVRAPCTFERASFSFLSGFKIQGLVVLAPDAPFGPPLLAAESAEADYTLDAFGAGPRVIYVDIFRPRLRFERIADGSLPIKDAFYLGGEGPTPRPFRVKLRDGAATYADLAVLAGGPLALTDVNIDVTPDPASDDWRFAAVALNAKSDVLGPIKARAVVGDAQASVSASLDLSQIRFDEATARRFVGDVARHVADMAPSGEATAHVVVQIEKGKDPAPEVDVVLRNAAVRVTLADDPAPAPIEATGIGGRFRYAAGRLDAADLVFRAHGAEFRAEATIEDVTSSAPRIEAKASVAALPIDEDLRGKLPRAYLRIAEAYDLRGTVAATTTVRGALASPDVGVVAKVTNGHVRYAGFVDKADGRRKGFAYDVEDVAGTVKLEGSTIRLDGTGRHGPATLRAEGAVVMAKAGHDVPDLVFVAENVPLDDSVRKAFNDGGAKSFVPWSPSGTAARITVRVSHDPAVDVDHDAVDVTIEVDGRASFVPHVFPAALSDVSGRVEVLEAVVDGRRESLVRLTDVAGKGDGFDVRVSGEVRGSDDTEREDLQVHADVAEFAGAFRTALERSIVPKGVIQAAQRLEPSGAMRIDAHVVGRADRTRGDVVDVALLGAAVTGYGDVPLAARDLTGRVGLVGDDVTFEDVAGEFVMGEFAPKFRAHGSLAGVSGDPQPTIHVEASEVPLGEPIRSVLGPLAEKAKGFWEYVAPVGSTRADLVLDLRPDADPTPFEVELVSMHGALRPLGLEVDCDGGTFHFDGRLAQMRGVDSAIAAATLRFDAVDYDTETGVVDVRVSAMRALRFPEDLEGPLSRETVERIAESAPGRTMHAPSLHFVYRPQPKSLEIDGTVFLRPRTRRPLHDEGYAPDGTLVLERLAFLMPDEGPVAFDGAARAEDFAFRVGLAVDRFAGRVEFSGELGEPTRFTAHVAGASFRVEEFPFTEAEVDVVPTRIGQRVEVVRSKFMGGAFTARVGPGEKSVGYQGHFNLEGADLERLLRERGSHGEHVASGVLDVGMKFKNPSGARSDLRGDGKIEVKRGHLAPAPGLGVVMLRFATLGLIAPDLTDGEMKFDLEGDRLHVTKLEVKSAGVNALTHGNGWIDLGGRLDVSVDGRLIDVDIPVVRHILGWFQKPFPTRVRVSGTLRNPVTAWAGYDLGFGSDEGRIEPPPAGDVRPAGRDPW